MALHHDKFGKMFSVGKICDWSEKMKASGLTKIGKRRVKDGKRNLERVVYMDSDGEYLVRFNGTLHHVRRVAYSGTYNDVEYYRL